MYSTDSRCYDPLNPSRNSQHKDRLIIYKTLVSNEDRCAIIAGRQDRLPDIVRKYHISHSTTNKDLTRSHHLTIRRPSSVILAQISIRSRETDAADRCKASGEG